MTFRAPMTLFVVVEEQGPHWNSGSPMRSQPGWDEHARFIDSLESQGFVVLGGPLHHPAGHRAMLVFDAPDEATVRELLDGDPWMQSEVLRVREIEPWELLIGRIH